MLCRKLFHSSPPHLSRLATDAIVVAVEAVRVGRANSEPPEGDVAAVQIGRWRRDTNRRIGWRAVGRASRCRRWHRHTRRGRQHPGGDGRRRHWGRRHARCRRRGSGRCRWCGGGGGRLLRRGRHRRLGSRWGGGSRGRRSCWRLGRCGRRSGRQCRCCWRRRHRRGRRDCGRRGRRRRGAAARGQGEHRNQPERQQPSHRVPPTHPTTDVAADSPCASSSRWSGAAGCARFS